MRTTYVNQSEFNAVALTKTLRNLVEANGGQVVYLMDEKRTIQHKMVEMEKYLCLSSRSEIESQQSMVLWFTINNHFYMVGITPDQRYRNPIIKAQIENGSVTERSLNDTFLDKKYAAAINQKRDMTVDELNSLAQMILQDITNMPCTKQMQVPYTNTVRRFQIMHY